MKDEDFSRQKREIFDLVKYFPVSLLRHPDFECDDVIAMVCKKYVGDFEFVVCSSDSDFIQLLENSNVSLWNPVKKSFIEPWPVDYLTWKSLKGDASDNIPGIKGVGDKTAMKLASDNLELEQFFVKKPDARLIYENCRDLIKFADLDPEDNKLENFSYNFDEKSIFNAFTEKGFKSIVGKSWSSWLRTMEYLNERKSTNYG